jgi:hypothetical protein
MARRLGFIRFTQSSDIHEVGILYFYTERFLKVLQISDEAM